jgi:acetoacetyl-CoA synthetase
VDDPAVSPWSEAVSAAPDFASVDVAFDHPLWVLFTSGTTGRPKGIVHGHGGVLLEQLVSPGLHMDLQPEDVFFWYTTPNWMMWNAQICGLLHGSTIVLFDGRPTYPAVDALWRVAAELGVTVLGTSPGYLEASAKAGLEPGRDLGLGRLKLIGVTGSVLPASANGWVREHVGPAVQLGSMSGGTDVVGIFVASAPTTPVYDGEISAVALGVALEVWGPAGERLPAGEVGEMVITAPMPSMPLRFWDDPGDQRLLDTYFSTYPGVWRQGDLTMLTARGTVVILGRSDATLNRNGVRLGSAEIYAAVSEVRGVADALVVGVERPDGKYWLPLFVVPEDDVDRTTLTATIRAHIARRASPRHVPDEIIYLAGLPRTKTGKRLEVPVKRILQGADPERVVSRDAIDFPEALDALVSSAAVRERSR